MLGKVIQYSTHCNTGLLVINEVIDASARGLNLNASLAHADWSEFHGA